MSGAAADLTVMTSDDDYDEDNGSIIAKVLTDVPESGSSATYSVGATNTATIGVMDDDDEPMASISSTYKAFEGSGDNDAGGLVVMLTSASRKIVQVAYTFADGTGDSGAENGVDYNGTNGTLTFTPDDRTGLTPTTMFVPFSIIPDNIDDPNETFTITLSTVPNGNATVSNTADMVTVHN